MHGGEQKMKRQINFAVLLACPASALALLMPSRVGIQERRTALAVTLRRDDG
jgi:hypothetical protein